MWLLDGILWMAGALAWARAAQANLRTSLIFAVIWGSLAWTWLTAAFFTERPGIAYVAVCFVGCAGVAVLGARSPGVLPWQFVVAGLLAILLLPLGEAIPFDAHVRLSGVRLVFLIGLLSTVFLNHLPTRLGIAVMCMGAATAVALMLAGEMVVPPAVLQAAQTCACAAPVMGWICLAWPRERTPADRLWLDFRDRFGAIWALRVREQFNRAAANSGLGATLTWSGVHGTYGPEVYELLCALLKRFGLPAGYRPGPPAPP